MSSSRSRAACLFLTVAFSSLFAAFPRLLPPGKTVQQRLKVIVDIEFEDTPFGAVIDILQAKSGIEFAIDTKSLEQAAVPLDSPISMKLERIAIKSVLRLVLHQVQMAYMIREDILVVTTKDHIDRPVDTVVFPVDDLVKGPKDEGELIDLITRSIDPGSWRIRGGKGTIRFSKETGYLQVFQHPDTLEQVSDMLAALRGLQGH